MRTHLGCVHERSIVAMDLFDVIWHLCVRSCLMPFKKYNVRIILKSIQKNKNKTRSKNVSVKRKVEVKIKQAD